MYPFSEQHSSIWLPYVGELSAPKRGLRGFISNPVLRV